MANSMRGLKAAVAAIRNKGLRMGFTTWAEAAADGRYVYRAPVQPPIRPAYQSFFERQKDEGADRK